MGLATALIRALAIMLAIPAIGFGVSFWIISDLNADLAKEGLPSYQALCSLISVLADASPSLRAACDEFSEIELLGDASILAAVIAVGVLAIYLLASVVAGKNRSRIASIFPPLVGFSLFAVSASVLLQGGILTYAAYIGEIYAIGRVHYFIIGGIGFGALIAAIKLIRVSFTFAKKHTMPVIGKSLNETTAPTLFGFVRELAEKLDARPPRNIVAGLEPNFFVTNCDVIVVGEDKTLSGETLYISPPLARLMTKDELAAVIGHELGHFRGDDTVYSMKFAPVYAGLGRALGVVQSEDDEGVFNLAKLPAIAMLSFMYELFARNEAAISRERELKADAAGAEASSPHSLAVALIKIALYSGLWAHAHENNIERLNEGKIARNLSLVFRNSAKFDVEQENLKDILDEVLEISISHPTDTHPAVGSRLSALGVEVSQITKQMLLVPGDAAIELFDKVVEIEEELTTLEHRLAVALGHVNFPDEEEQERDYVLQAAYCLTAAMVAVDEKIEADEIAIAESIGNRLFEDYDPVEFREYINHPGDIPDIDNVAQIIGGVLPEEGKILILKYLKAISEADQDVDEREAALLSKIAKHWHIDESALLSDSGDPPTEVGPTIIAGLRWTENPGCFEGHLKRKHNNPLFLEPDREVNQEQIDEARERDQEDAAKLQEELLQLASDFEKLPELATVDDVGPFRERIDDLLDKAAGIGGDVDAIRDSLNTLRKSLIDFMREGVGNNEEALRALEKADEFHQSRVQIFHTPFMAQVERIPSEDTIPAMLSESPGTIRKAMALIGGDKKALVVKEACELMKSALAEGADIPLADEKLKAIRGEDD